MPAQGMTLTVTPKVHDSFSELPTTDKLDLSPTEKSKFHIFLYLSLQKSELKVKSIDPSGRSLGVKSFAYTSKKGATHLSDQLKTHFREITHQPSQQGTAPMASN